MYGSNGRKIGKLLADALNILTHAVVVAKEETL